MMYASEIRCKLESDNRVQPRFRGVFPADRLPLRIHRYPACLVVNTDTSRGPGKHWVAFYFDSHKTGEFWDSFGHPPEHYHISFHTFLLRNSRRRKVNQNRLQNNYSDVCGHYCIYFLAHRCVGYSMNQILSRFTLNTLRNDVIVRRYASRYRSHNCPLLGNLDQHALPPYLLF